MDESTQTTLTKVCCACERQLPLEEFHRNARARDGTGRQYKCRECCSAYQRQYNEIHSEARAKRRAEQRSANPERDRAATRAWEQANGPRIAATKRAYRANNAEKIAERNRLWKLQNPEKVTATKLRRRARERNAKISSVELKKLWDGYCGICSAPLDSALKWPDLASKSIDHIIPLARGGAHAQWNLQWAHLGCNVRKGAKLPTPTEQARRQDDQTSDRNAG